MSSLDFIRWSEWYQKTCSATLPLDDATLTRVYHQHYSCSCETCVFRKEHGLVPMRGVGSPQCTLHPAMLDLRRVRELLERSE